MLKTQVNLTELAKSLNLSKGTVSRILNNKPAPFSPQTRERVLTMAKNMGYQPNPLARALVTGRTGCVSLWVQDLLSSYRASVAQYFESRLEEEAYSLSINLHGHGVRDERKAEIANFMRVTVDGIIAHEPGWDWWPYLDQIVDRGLPVVGSGLWRITGVLDHVIVNLDNASRQAVEHLVDSGRSRIAYLSHFLHTGAQDPRFVAYNEVLADAGLPVEYIGAMGNRHEIRHSVRRHLRAYAESNVLPDAIFCHNDDAAIAAYRALCDIGAQVPGDVALIGCDGIEDTEYLATPLTTIAQPYEDLTKYAWQFLKRRIDEPDASPQEVTLNAALVIRESSGN